MIFVYQVLYRLPGDHPACSLTVEAENPEAARAKVEAGGYIVFDVTQGRAPIAPNQQTYNREEAATFLRCDASTVDCLMAKGELPKARNGRPIFTRRMLEEVIAKRMGTQEQAAA